MAVGCSAHALGARRSEHRANVWCGQVTYSDLANLPRIGHAPLIIWGLVVATLILLTVALVSRETPTREPAVTDGQSTR
jgi:hypothetical protein